MNCQEARRHWDLYYDSEGDAELHFQLNEHLDGCVDCAEWFSQQSRLETLIEERLRASSASDKATAYSAENVDWTKVLLDAGVSPASKSRSWMFFGSTILALAASVLLILSFAMQNRHSDRFDDGQPSLSRLTAGVHQHVSSGSLRPEFESDSDLEIDAYLLKRVSFPVRCPPRKDSGFDVQGAGLCELAKQPAAYVVGRVDNEPVSIFVLSRESLVAFPRQQDELSRELIHLAREGDNELAYSVIDKNVVLVIGKIDQAKLQRVLNSYGSYPHAT